MGGMKMKQLLLLFTFVLSMQSFAFDSMDKAENSIKLENKMTKSSQIFWTYSATTCSAATVCPNGRRIYCRTYGYNYSNIPSYMTNSCSWALWPGRGVQCRGYVQKRDFYGNFYWAYVNLPVSCY
jgi:hypothetical protein